MVFEIKNKIALITGGASGIGINYAKELLRNGAKGVTLADINPEFGAQALKEIEKLFGTNKAIFVKTDVTNYEEFEGAFLETIKHFGNIDILINNAGIANDAQWEKEILVNVNGTIHGMILGIENYLPKYKQHSDALILNISSIAATENFSSVPVYCATKHAVLGMVKSWGISEFYEETKVRVIGLCPGVTNTSIITNLREQCMGDRYKRYLDNTIGSFPTQKPEYVAEEAMKVIQFALNGTVWVIEGGEPAYEYIIPERMTMKNNVLCFQE